MTAPTAPPLFADVTLSMISWKAHNTLRNTIDSYAAAGILELFADKRIHFNEISQADIEIAEQFGFSYTGSSDNSGIFGAVDRVAEHVRTPFVLSLENDCPLVTDKAGLVAMLSSALADMNALGVPVFQMRSRREPGDLFARRQRYEQRFQIIWPISTPESNRRAMPHIWRRTYEDLRRSPLRGSALFAEEDPTLRHPRVIQKSPNGNWITGSRYLSWSNNGVLVRSEFLRNVILDRVRRFPAKSTLNGHQDIEAALKMSGWWRKQGFLMGQSEPGPFTHRRLDR